MTDYCQCIVNNLKPFKGIVDYPDKVSELNEILKELATSGFDLLVENFCNQNDPDRAWDFLFEIWVCRMLRANSQIQHLSYEPQDVSNPPDFRFVIDNVTFNMEVKRLTNTVNELTKTLFERECRKRLSKIPQPWFINFWISDHFERRHINNFFADVRTTIKNNGYTSNHKYGWPTNGQTLVEYLFIEKKNKAPGIVPGIIEIHSDNIEVNVEAIRNGVKRQIKRSQSGFTKPVSEHNSNVVIIQSDTYTWLANDTMEDVLYGDEAVTNILTSTSSEWREHRLSNGLFRPEQFSKICGVILIPDSISPLDSQFKGTYFPQPSHLAAISSHPKPFNEMTYCIPPEWKKA